MSKKSVRFIGSPIVKHFQPKPKKQSYKVPLADTASDWSTVEQSTTSKTSVEQLRQDWSEEDSDNNGYEAGEESDLEFEAISPGQLRESLVHPSPFCCPPAVCLKLIAAGDKIQLARSPAIDCLAELLDLKAGQDKKYCLLPSTASTSCSTAEESDVSSMPIMGEVLTSTMLVDDKTRVQDVVGENLSFIKTRESLDPRQSVEPSKTQNDVTPSGGRLKRKRQVGASVSSNRSSRPVKILSSTLARKDRSGYSPGLSSIHSFEAGGSMLVPRMAREMITEEKVEETKVVEDTLCLSEVEPIKQCPGDIAKQEAAVTDSETVLPLQPVQHSSSQNTVRPGGSDNTLLHQLLSQSPGNVFHQQSSPHLQTSHRQTRSPDEAFPQHSQSPSKISQESQSPDPTVLVTDSGPESPSQPRVCQYPAPPHSKDVVVITQADYETLYEGTFLNDVIIDFYLTYLYREMIPEQKDKVFIFPSFFFTKLSSDPVKESKSKLSLAEMRHKQVATWTKNVDLCNKQLVIIPICKDKHWYLVTLVLDSLDGDNEDVVDMIKGYLVIELSSQMGEERLQLVEEIVVVYPVKPLQDNHTDCGVFLLHYAEKMLQRPEQMLCLDRDSNLKDWFPMSEVKNKRKDMAKLIRKMAEDQSLPSQAPALPELFAEVDSFESEVAVFEEEQQTHDDDLSLSIQEQLANLSPDKSASSTHSRSRSSTALSAEDTSGDIFSAVVHKNQVPVIVSYRNPSSLIPIRAPIRKRFRLANYSEAAAKLRIFTKDEYYWGKPSSERKFDEFLEEEEDENSDR
eukprot:GFUD01019876.1.p1 GENE.GFUD01019876.1~~GFUD01019876.1.p1  ORF type:complete len:795 (-),score=260.36 GFUD01019876.1:80-2464(-)